MKTVDLPDFETDEQYCKWLSETEEGKQHNENIKRINAEIRRNGRGSCFFYSTEP